MEGFLQDGRYKTQFETGYSNGSYLPSMRADAEDRMFNYDPHETKSEERPIYGHMSDSWEPGAMYGNTSLVLHPHVLDRTTLTHGDSLGAGTVPISHADAASGKIDPAIHGDTTESGYVEAQYHGGIKASDVAHAEFDEKPASYGKHDPARVQSALDQAGIPWRKMRTEVFEQPQLENPKEGTNRPAFLEDDTRPKWYRYEEGDKDFGPIVSRRQFPVQTSPGFRSPWVGGGAQRAYGPTGHKEYVDLVNKREGNT